MDLARKYRPKKWEQMIGQPEAVAILRAMLRKKSVEHFLLFTGPSGCGKTTAARIMKRELNCADIDFCEIDAADDRGIDAVREIKRKMTIYPFSGKKGCRIYLLDEVHMMMGTAQNALLKALEDTPDWVYFILCTTDPHKLLRTILTRASEVKFRSLTHDELEKHVKDVCHKEQGDVSEEVLDAIVDQSEGSPRKALKLLGQVITLTDEGEQLEAVRCTQTKAAAIQLARTLMDVKANWPNVAELLKELEDEPEALRRMILGYATQVLLGGGKGGVRAFLLIKAFEMNYYDSGKAGLVASCFEFMHQKQ